MIRKILDSLPFIHHQPPLNMPLRKAVIMAIQRPVKIKQIEDFLFKRLNKNGETVIQELEEAIFYLRKERFFKRDSSNLFVAGLRAACTYNANVGINFGKQFIREIPDTRAIRTLVTFMNRTKRFNEIPSVLQYSKNSSFVRQKRSQIAQTTLIPDNIDEARYPWTFDLVKPCKLLKKPTYFKHKFDECLFQMLKV